MLKATLQGIGNPIINFLKKKILEYPKHDHISLFKKDCSPLITENHITIDINCLLGATVPKLKNSKEPSILKLYIFTENTIQVLFIPCLLATTSAFWVLLAVTVCENLGEGGQKSTSA